MGILFAKENELGKQEMKMGREIKRRKNEETIGKMTGEMKKGEIRRRQIGRRGKKEEGKDD